MVIINLKTESQIVNRKPHPKVTNILPFPGLAQTGTEQRGQGATLLGWPKSIYYVHICGERGWDKGDSTYLQNGVCRVESNANIVKAGFHYFRSFLDQNALLKGSQTSRKCAQEFSNGKEWVLRCLQDTFGGRSATAMLPLNNRARTTMLYMNALWSGEKGKLSSYCISCLVL